MERQPEQEDGRTKATSSAFNSFFNTTNAILGIAILSTPFAIQEAGWMLLSILVLMASTCCYTAHILAKCVSLHGSYVGVAEAAFGPRVKLPFTLLFQYQLTAILVASAIAIGDSLSRLFPHAAFKFGHLHLSSSQLMLLISFCVILPTVWVRELKWISYISAAGVACYAAIFLTLIYTGFTTLSFSHPVPALKSKHLLNAIGIFGYCVAGHCAFPAIYSSLKNRQAFLKVVLMSYFLCTTVYITFGLVGVSLFGSELRPQVSLNVPIHLRAAKLILWLVVSVLLTKFGLILGLVAAQAENFLPKRFFMLASVTVRSCLLSLIFLVALVFPHFETAISLVGSFSGMLFAIILPSTFYLKLFYGSIVAWERGANFVIIILGVVIGGAATFATVADVVKKAKN